MAKSSNSILFVIDHLGVGGAQNQVFLIAKAFQNLKWEVTILYYHSQEFFKQKFENEGIHLISCPKKEKIGINVILKLRSLLKENAYCAVVSFLNTPNLYSAIAHKYSKTNTNLIISYRSRSVVNKVNPSQWYKTWINKTAQKIVFNSHHERINWLDKYPHLEKKATTIYNAVDFQSIQRKKDFEFNYKLLVLGKPRPLKNGILLIEAMNLLKVKNALNFNVEWIGYTNFKQASFNSYVDKMNKLIQLYGLENHWSWKNPVRNVGSLFKEYDALVHPSLLEGLPNVICESLYAGTPVLASRLFDHPLLIKDGERGFLFDPREPKALADTILKLYGLKQETYKSMIKSCITYAEQNFAIDHISNKWLQLINPDE